MINPYNFVRSGRAIPRQPARHLASFSGRTGTIVCRLKVITPIFTRGRQEQIAGGANVLRFFTAGRTPALPASSLKGMLRIHAEAISNGCGPLDSREHPPCPPPGDVRQLPSLCVVCRIFGYLSRETVYPGRIR